MEASWFFRIKSRFLLRTRRVYFGLLMFYVWPAASLYDSTKLIPVIPMISNGSFMNSFMLMRVNFRALPSQDSWKNMFRRLFVKIRKRLGLNRTSCLHTYHDNVILRLCLRNVCDVWWASIRGAFPSSRLHIMQIHKYRISRSIFHNFARVMKMWDDKKNVCRAQKLKWIYQLKFSLISSCIFMMTMMMMDFFRATSNFYLWGL